MVGLDAVIHQGEDGMKFKALVVMAVVAVVAVVYAPTGTAALRPPKLSITGFAAEPVPPEIRPTYWADDGRYITTGSATWASQPRVQYYFCLKNLTAPVGRRGYDRNGCIGIYDPHPDHFSWAFDPYSFPNDVGGVDGGFYSGELIEFYVLGVLVTFHGPVVVTSNIVYETIQ